MLSQVYRHPLNIHMHICECGRFATLQTQCSKPQFIWTPVSYLSAISSLIFKFPLKQFLVNQKAYCLTNVQNAAIYKKSHKTIRMLII